jgi:hypothetical protein
MVSDSISLGCEDPVALVAALDDVKRLAFGKEAGQAGHGEA